jgi:hypothetical protein
VTRIIWFALFCFMATGTLLAWRALATGPSTVAAVSPGKSTSPVVNSAKASTKTDKLEINLVNDTPTIEPSDIAPVETVNAMAFIPPETHPHTLMTVLKVDRKQSRSKSADSFNRLIKKPRSQKQLQANRSRPNSEEKRCTQQSGLDGVLSALNLKPKCGV